MKYGVFAWRPDGVYKRKHAVKVYKRRRAALDYAKKRTMEWPDFWSGKCSAYRVHEIKE